MSERFILKVILDFAAAHQLKDYDGDCAKLHGHNWKIEIEVSSTKLDNFGMVIDFKVIKREVKSIIKQLDHSFLNEHPHFKKVNPTAENVAAYLFNEIQRKIETNVVKMHGITVWENDRNCIYYTQNN